MLRNREKRIRRRSRPEPSVEPIHLDELLGAAGMSGFLGVLDPPAVAPHLSGAFADLAVGILPEQGREVAIRFSNRIESAAGGLGRQQEMLYEVTAVARRMLAAAELLERRTRRFESKEGEQANGRQDNTQESHPGCRQGRELGGVGLPEREGAIAG